MKFNTTITYTNLRAMLPTETTILCNNPNIYVTPKSIKVKGKDIDIYLDKTSVANFKASVNG